MSGRGTLTHQQHHHQNGNSVPSRTVINGHDIMMFDDKDTKWIPAKHPLHSDKPEKCGVGPGIAFAKLIAELNVVETNRKIGLIPCAVGGTSIKQWLPKNIKVVDNECIINEFEEDNHDNILNDGLFEKSIQKTILALNTKFENGSKSKLKSKILRKAKNGSLLSYNHFSDTDDGKMADGLDIELKAILWHQGESDCDTQQNADNYLSESIVLFENFRRSLNNENIPIIVGGLASFLGKKKDDRFLYYNIINRSLMSLPSRLHNVAFVTADSLNHKGDFLHFDSESSEILGQRYAAKYAELSGSLTNEELSKYIRFNKFKNVLKRHSSKAYQKTKGISVRTWLVGIAVTSFAIYAYKKYYGTNDDNKH